jgi:DNA-binding CsgD family transcriptional regulator/GAF domain-containing protein
LTAAEHSATSLVGFVGELVEARDLGQLADSCVKGLKRLVPSSAVSFDLVEPEADRGETVAAVGVSDYFLTRYEQLGRRRDPVLRRAVKSCRAVDNSSLMSTRRWRSLPVYRDVFQLHRLTNVLYAPVVIGDSVVATLDVGRGDHPGRFSEDEIKLVQSLAAAVGAAFASLSERDRLVRERLQLGAALDACDEAVVVTDSQDGRRHLNSSARRLVARTADGGAALDDLLARTSAGGGGLVAKRRVELADGSEVVLRSRSRSLDAQPGVLVSVLRLDEDWEGLASVIEESLSPREREVARLAMRGLHDAEIAERLVLSPHTVKHHLKGIYRKLGLRSRVELAGLAR